MALTNQIVPPGFVEFEPSSWTKAIHRIKSPLHHIGYTVFIQKTANAFIEVLSPYQQMPSAKRYMRWHQIHALKKLISLKTPLINVT